MDAKILFTVGQCRFPLIRASRLGLGYSVQNLGEQGRVLSTDHGAIETTTRALANLFSEPWEHADHFVSEAVKSRSQRLLSRLLIALRAVAERKIDRISPWADTVARTVLYPSIKKILNDDLKRAGAKPARKARSRSDGRQRTDRPSGGKGK